MSDIDMERGFSALTTNSPRRGPALILQPAIPAQSQTQPAPAGKSQVPKVLNGFPRSSRFIAADPDKTTVIFRRFDEASVRVLLQLEARVAALEKVLNTLDSADYYDHRENGDMILAASSWEEFALLGSGSDHDQLPQAALDMWKKARLDRRSKIAARDREVNLVSPNELIKRQRQRKTHLYPTVVQPPRAPSPYRSAENNTISRQTSLDRVRPRSHGSSIADIPDRATLLDCNPETMRLIEQRWEVAEKLEIAMEKYQEALLRYQKLLDLDAPAPRSAAALRDWINGRGKKTNTGTPYPQFAVGTAMENIFGAPPVQSMSWLSRLWYRIVTWGKVTPSPPIPMTSTGATGVSEDQPKVNDLVGLRPSPSNDPLTRRIARTNWIFRLEKDKNYPYPEIDHVPEAGIQKYVTIITMIIALAFLVAALWSLWGAEHTHYTYQLFVLSVWVCLFGLAMKFGTSASRPELFGTTAAYAAVLVVFVGKGMEKKEK